MTNEEKAKEIGLAKGNGAVNVKVIIATAGALEMEIGKMSSSRSIWRKRKGKF